MFWYKVWKFLNWRLRLSYIRSWVIELGLLIFWNWICYWFWTSFWLTSPIFFFSERVFGVCLVFFWVSLWIYWGLKWVLSLGILILVWGFVFVFCLWIMISNVTIFFLLGFIDRASSSQICQTNKDNIRIDVVTYQTHIWSCQ